MMKKELLIFQKKIFIIKFIFIAFLCLISASSFSEEKKENIIKIAILDSLKDVESRYVSSKYTAYYLNGVNLAIQQAGKVGGGHFSPVVAYDPKTDSVLFLDVSSFKYPPIWVSIADLYCAMHTKDSNTNTYRGFLIASKS